MNRDVRRDSTFKGRGYSAYIVGLALILVMIEMVWYSPTLLADTSLVDSASVSQSAMDVSEWQWQYPDPPSQNYNDIDCPTINICYAISEGMIIKLIDGGKQINFLQSHTTYSLRAIECISESNCIAVGSSGTIIQTKDAGIVWQHLTSNVSQWLYDINCPSSLTCFVVGNQHHVLKTSDGGQSWSNQQIGNSNPLSAIDCLSELICLAVGQSGSIQTTGNSGITWNSPLYGESESLYAISCISSTHCIASGFSNTLHVTGGDGAWKVEIGNPANPYQNVSDLHCPTQETCYMVSGITIGISHDSGGTWSNYPIQDTWLYEISCPQEDSCFAVGLFGVIYKINSTGQSDPILPNRHSSIWNKATCPSNTHCYVAGDDGILITKEIGRAHV